MNSPRFEQLWKQVGKVKLGKGLVSKLCQVMIFAVVGISLIPLALAMKGDSWAGPVAVISLLLIVGLVAYLGPRIMDFAAKYPGAALFEGSELLVHQQMVFREKGHESETPITIVQTGDPTNPLPLLESPDESEPEQLHGARSEGKKA